MHSQGIQIFDFACGGTAKGLTFSRDLARNDLPELSERARIAEKLCHALGSVVGLNFKGLEDGGAVVQVGS